MSDDRSHEHGVRPDESDTGSEGSDARPVVSGALPGGRDTRTGDRSARSDDSGTQAGESGARSRGRDNQTGGIGARPGGRDTRTGGIGAFPDDYDGRSDATPRPTAGGRRRWTDWLPADRLAQFGLVVVVAIIVLAAFGPIVSPYDPVEQNLLDRLASPSLAHPLGTDHLGRDVLTRLLHGARLSLGIAVAVTTVRLVVGTTVGLVAGYAGGWIDEALMRLTDTLLAFPGIVFALVIAGVLGPSLVNAMIALAVVGWASYARLVRSSVLSYREREFVTAARLLGRSRTHVATRHLLPNAIAPVVVLATLDIGGVVLGTAGLSFLGLGAQPPTPEWGTMLASGRNYLRQAWWLVNAPGVCIMLTVFGFNLLGDRLRERLSPSQSAQIERL